MRMIHWHEEDKGLGRLVRMKLANESVSWRGCLYITIPTSTLHATDTTMTTATFHYHFRFLCNWRSLQVRSGLLPQRSLSLRTPKYQSTDSVTKLTSCAAATTICSRPSSLSVGASLGQADCTWPQRSSRFPQWIRSTVTTAAALCVNAAVNKVAWWPWSWKWCPSRVWRGLPLCQF